jgi:hypothetical protein
MAMFVSMMSRGLRGVAWIGPANANVAPDIANVRRDIVRSRFGEEVRTRPTPRSHPSRAARWSSNDSRFVDARERESERRHLTWRNELAPC